MISIIVSSNRPYYWNDFEKNFYCDLVDEIIFIGPINYKKKLDNRSKYIKSFFKPVQCLAQGIHKSKNDLFFFAPDDIYCNKDFLKPYLKDSISYLKKKIVLVPRFFMDKKEVTNGLRYKENDSFFIPVFSIISKKIYREIGGFDKNFIAILFDIDFYLRLFFIKGYKSELINNFKIFELPQSINKGNLSKDYWLNDRSYLDSLWSFNNEVGYKRKKEVSSFDLDTINTFSQGKNVLKWSKNNYLFILINDFFLVRIIRSIKNQIRELLYSIKNKFYK